MAQEVNLEKIKQALNQSNAALKKRALAIIFNDAIVEAKGFLEEYIGRETDASLQAMALQVLKKLEGFQNQSSQVSTDKIVPLLASSDAATRILGLRALMNRTSPDIPKLILENCSKEDSPEAIALIAEILKINPAPENLPKLISLTSCPGDKIRIDAIEGIINIMNGCLYPYILKALLDPSTQIKMKAYQMISKISRANLIDSLGFMLDSGDALMARLAGQLFPAFLGDDLLPLLKKHSSHSDQETIALVKRGLVLMAQKGNSEAVAILENFKKAAAPGETATASSDTQSYSSGLQKIISNLPNWLVEPFFSTAQLGDPQNLIFAVKDVFARTTDFLSITFLTAYFTFGKRSPPLDKTCFRALQIGLSKSDPVQLLRTIAPALPEPSSKEDLFPIMISHRLLNDFSDTLLEQILSFQETFRLLDENPSEVTKFHKAIMDGIESLLKAINSIVSNKVAVKFTDGIALKTFNFCTSKPVPMDAKIVSSIDLQINKPLLLSGDLSKKLDLAPFLHLTPSKRGLEKAEPTEQALWDFLNKNKITESYLMFLKNKEA